MYLKNGSSHKNVIDFVFKILMFLLPELALLFLMYFGEVYGKMDANFTFLSTLLGQQTQASLFIGQYSSSAVACRQGAIMVHSNPKLKVNKKFIF